MQDTRVLEDSFSEKTLFQYFGPSVAAARIILKKEGTASHSETLCEQSQTLSSSVPGPSSERHPPLQPCFNKQFLVTSSVPRALGGRYLQFLINLKEATIFRFTQIYVCLLTQYSFSLDLVGIM